MDHAASGSAPYDTICKFSASSNFIQTRGAGVGRGADRADSAGGVTGGAVREPRAARGLRLCVPRCLTPDPAYAFHSTSTRAVRMLRC